VPDENDVYYTRTLTEGETEGELKAKLELYGPTRQLSTDFGTYYYMEDRAQQRLKDLNDFWFKNVNNFEYYPSVTFTLEETETINEYISDIQALTSEQTAKWLVDGGIDEGWDSYVSQLDNIGLQEVVKAWQDAYDRYKAEIK
jgi:putative aldouronate transport system substrate-binding protein